MDKSRMDSLLKSNNKTKSRVKSCSSACEEVLRPVIIFKWAYGHLVLWRAGNNRTLCVGGVRQVLSCSGPSKNSIAVRLLWSQGQSRQGLQAQRYCKVCWIENVFCFLNGVFLVFLKFLIFLNMFSWGIGMEWWAVVSRWWGWARVCQRVNGRVNMVVCCRNNYHEWP